MSNTRKLVVSKQTATDLDRLNSEDLERVLTAEMIALPDAIDLIAAVATPDDFFYDDYRAIVGVLYEMRAKHQSIDAISLAIKVRDVNPDFFKSFGGRQAFEDLAAEGFLADNLMMADRAHQIKQYALRRQSLPEIEAAKEALADPAVSFQDAIDLASSATEKLTRVSSVRQVSIDPISVTNRWYERFEGSSLYDPCFIPTGLIDVDRMLAGGLEYTDFVVLAAGSMHGKTAFMLDVVRRMATSPKAIKSLVFSLEMPTEQLLRRVVAQTSRIGIAQLKNPKALRENDPVSYQKVLNSRDSVRKLETTYIDQSYLATVGGLTPAVIESEVTKWIHRNNLERGQGVIWLDHLQIAGKDSATYEAVKDIPKFTYVLNKIAKAYGLPVVALSQVSPNVEKRDNKRPTRSDLAWSSSIFTDADIVAALFRQDASDISNAETPTGGGITELFTMKNRDLEPSSVKILFSGKTMSFENYAAGY